MAYTSVRGRKPLERASKISHAEIINNPEVQEYLAGAWVPKPPESATVASHLTAVPEPSKQRIKAVVAIDGGYREVSVREEFPSVTITFFTFGPLFFRLEDLHQLDAEPFIAPEDLARLKNIQRFTFVLPTKNISREGKTLRLSVRETLLELFLRKPNEQDPPLMEAFRWLLFRGWTPEGEKAWEVPRCPNPGCDRRDILLTPESPDIDACTGCGGPIFLVDALRLHEAVDEEQGAGGILAYVMTTLEQLVLVQLVKALWEMSPRALREVIFVKDGPLAFFGQTAPLSRPMRELASFLGDQPDPTGTSGATTSLLSVVGLEKSGAFVEHAIQIEQRMEPNTVLIPDNTYIYRYVVPGDPASSHPYGKNTYWAGKLVYKAGDGNIYVATVPTGGYEPSPTFEDFYNLAEVLAVVGSLKCSMYDNALVPIALANKLVSLSEFPSARILGSFAKGTIDLG